MGQVIRFPPPRPRPERETVGVVAMLEAADDARLAGLNMLADDITEVARAYVELERCMRRVEA